MEWDYCNECSIEYDLNSTKLECNSKVQHCNIMITDSETKCEICSMEYFRNSTDLCEARVQYCDIMIVKTYD